MSTLVPLDPAMTELASLKLLFSGNRVVSRTSLFRRQADAGGDPRAGGFPYALAAVQTKEYVALLHFPAASCRARTKPSTRPLNLDEPSYPDR